MALLLMLLKSLFVELAFVVNERMELPAPHAVVMHIQYVPEYMAPTLCK